MNKEAHDLCMEYSELRAITSLLMELECVELLTITKGKFIKAARRQLKHINKNFSAEKLFTKLVEYEILIKTDETYHNAMTYEYRFLEDRDFFWLYGNETYEAWNAFFTKTNNTKLKQRL